MSSLSTTGIRDRTVGHKRYHGDMFPEWKGSIFVGAWWNEAVRLQMKDGKVAVRNGCCRTGANASAQQGPDGAIYVLTGCGENSELLRPSGASLHRPDMREAAMR
jgi:glucose/arabinose dehydrogenase